MILVPSNTIKACHPYGVIGGKCGHKSEKKSMIDIDRAASLDVPVDLVKGARAERVTNEENA